NNSLFWRNWFHDQLDDCHWGVIARAVTDLGDTGVSPFTVRHGRANDGEQFVHNRFVRARVTGDKTLYLTTGSQVTCFCEGDETFGIRLQTLCLSKRGLDGLVFEQADRQVRQHTTLVCRAAAQARSFGWGWHEFSLYDFPALCAGNQWFKYVLEPELV